MRLNRKGACKNNNLPSVTPESFKTKRGKDANFIMAFDNGQIVHCYGHEGNEAALKDKCENYYLNHPAISAYKIHANPFI